MDDSELTNAMGVLRWNLVHSAEPNMRRAIAKQAPIAALLYGLALVDAMAGFFYGSEARRTMRRDGSRGDGVGLRYTQFVKAYLSPAHSGCDYYALDLYGSLRCNMAHSLTPGHLERGQFLYELRQDAAAAHATTISGRTIVFDVPTFCSDALGAATAYLDEVLRAIGQEPRPEILRNFEEWWDGGYRTMVSA